MIATTPRKTRNVIAPSIQVRMLLRIAEIGHRPQKLVVSASEILRIVVPAPDSSIRGQASAGTQWRGSPTTLDSRFRGNDELELRGPSGVGHKRHWIPAFAGMTSLSCGTQ